MGGLGRSGKERAGLELRIFVTTTIKQGAFRGLRLHDSNSRGLQLHAATNGPNSKAKGAMPVICERG